MRQRTRLWTCAIMAVALIAGLALLSQQRRQSEVAIARETIMRKAAPAEETTKIVPADVLGTGVVPWAPLTGDGSN
jgi:hypothetical protein